MVIATPMAPGHLASSGAHNSLLEYSNGARGVAFVAEPVYLQRCSTDLGSALPLEGVKNVGRRGWLDGETVGLGCWG